MASTKNVVCDRSLPGGETVPEETLPYGDVVRRNLAETLVLILSKKRLRCLCSTAMRFLVTITHCTVCRRHALYYWTTKYPGVVECVVRGPTDEICTLNGP